MEINHNNADLYAACYCEENIYRLCCHFLQIDPQRLMESRDIVEEIHPSLKNRYFAIFISNPEKLVPIFYQRAGLPRNYVLWDYHVILMDDKEKLIYDFDTTLQLPCPSRLYFDKTFPAETEVSYPRFFRVIPAESYLEKFSSDRSHMLTPAGLYTMKPPTWTTIFNKQLDNNIHQFISMHIDTHISSISNVYNHEEAKVKHFY